MSFTFYIMCTLTTGNPDRKACVALLGWSRVHLMFSGRNRRMCPSRPEVEGRKMRRNPKQLFGRSIFEKRAVAESLIITGYCRRGLLSQSTSCHKTDQVLAVLCSLAWGETLFQFAFRCVRFIVCLCFVCSTVCQAIGRLKIELFADVVPKTAENFR